MGEAQGEEYNTTNGGENGNGRRSTSEHLENVFCGERMERNTDEEKAQHQHSSANYSLPVEGESLALNIMAEVKNEKVEKLF